MTPVSSVTPYMSVQDFVDRCDQNSIAQYATDAPNPWPSPLPQALYTHPRVTAAVMDACGQLEAACLKFEAATLLAALRRDFSNVKHVKPAASRSDSAELYLLATGFRG